MIDSTLLKYYKRLLFKFYRKFLFERKKYKNLRETRLSRLNIYTKIFSTGYGDNT